MEEMSEDITQEWAFYHNVLKRRASLLAQRVKNPPATWETWVQPRGWEDPLEKGTATHTTILAWRVPRTV